jgi:hypothetical protein
VNLQWMLQLVGFAAEIALIAILVHKRVYRAFPLFCGYLVWDLADNLALYLIFHFYPALYLKSYLVALAIDSVFIFALLVELAWSVLRPFRSALPRGAIAVVAILVGVIGAAIWPFAHSAAYAHYGPQSRLLLHMQQTVSVMRIFFFLVLAGCSRLLSINWRDRELQIATGLGFFSLVSLIASILQAGRPAGPVYAFLNQLVIISMECAYFYWIYSFVHDVAPRREFTPQMQGFLLAVAGAARSARVSLTDLGNSQSDGQDK